jgi:hypothetical protein
MRFRIVLLSSSTGPMDSSNRQRSFFSTSASHKKQTERRHGFHGFHGFLGFLNP